MSIEQLYELFKQSKGIATDSRVLSENKIFFALKGENHDANQYAADALENGCSHAVVDDPAVAVDSRYLVFEDTLKVLQELANYHRKQFDIPVIGLTGSNGKTTNKELLSAVLATTFKVHATKGNLNNHFGVPFTLLSMPEDTEIAVIEMGANHPGEIKMLCEIAEPTHGFLTNIGKAHLEGFGGEEGVKKGKGELFDYLKENRGIIFVNEEDTLVADMAKDRNIMTVVYFGKDKRALKMLTDSPVVEFEVPEIKEKFISHLGGDYNFRNMQTAYNIGMYFNVNSDQACTALAQYNPENNRSQTVVLGSNKFLLDAYNANPSSMEAALKAFAKLETNDQKVVVLADMNELGVYAKEEHAKLGRLIASLNFDYVALFGEQMQHALAYLPRAHYFTDKFSMKNWLIDMQFENTYFLIKGSRSFKLEDVFEALKISYNL